MLIKLFIIYWLINYSKASNNSSASTILSEENETVDPLVILEQLRYEQVSAKNKQLNNSSSSIVNNSTTSSVSTVYNRFPCSCLKGQCGCCSGSFLESFNQKACVNITYVPDDFAFDAALSINGQVFYKNRISGKNPPPICFRLPRIRVVRVCARFSNVYFTGPNMHACVGMEADWNDFTLFNSLFNCFRVGAAGVAIVSPEDGGGINTNIDEDDDNDEDDDDDDEDYDDSARNIYANYITI